MLEHTKKQMRNSIMAWGACFSVFLLTGCQMFWGAEVKVPVVEASKVEGVAPEEATLPEKKPFPRFDHQTAGQVFRHYLSASVAEMDGNLETAGRYYQNALEADPNNTFLMEKAFSFLLASGQHKKAIEVAERLTEPGQKQALVEMVLIFNSALSGEYDEALKRLERMRRFSPNLIQFELLENYIQIAQGVPVQSIIEKLKEFDASQGLVAYKYYHLGRLYLRAGETKKALETLHDGRLLTPNALFIVQLLGDILQQEGRFDEAMAVYKSFLALNPESVLVLEGLRHAQDHAPVKVPVPTLADDLVEVTYGFASLLIGGDLEQTARQFLQLALMAKSDYPMAVFLLGLLDEQVEAFEGALANYRSIPKGSVPYLAAQIRIAEVYFSQGKPEEAITAFQSLVKAYPTLPFLHRPLAQFYFNTENFAKAVTHYTLALGEGGVLDAQQKATVLFARGAAYERLKEFNKSAEDLKASLELQPENATVLNYLGYMWLDRGENLDEAYEYIRQAARLRPHDGAIIDSLGWLYYKKGAYETAVRHLEKAAALLPNDPVIQLHLGQAYFKVGRHEEARIKWQRALELSPKDAADVQQLHQLLKQD